MKKYVFFWCILIFILIYFIFDTYKIDKSNNLFSLKITSSYFQNNWSIPSSFTCDGADDFPRVDIGELTHSEKFIALVVDDSDAPNGDWVHLVAYNIPLKWATWIITADTLKQASLWVNDFKKTGWWWPCPPIGDTVHHYHFRVYGLSREILYQASITKNELLNQVSKVQISYGELVGLYGRK